MWQRVGKDDFEKVNELRKGFGSDIWDWRVCSEYELREVEEDGCLIQYLVRKYPFDPFRPDNEDKWTRYNPLEDTPDLFLRFARLYDRGDSIEPIVDWVHRYGVLGHGPGAHRSTTPQSVEGFKRAVREAAGILAMYEAVLNSDSERAKFLVLEEFPILGRFFRLCNTLPEVSTPTGREIMVAFLSEKIEEHFGGDYLGYALWVVTDEVDEMVRHHCYPTLTFDIVGGHHDPSKVKAGWGYNSLLAAMYLQMYWLVGAGGDVTRCRYCGRIVSLARPRPDARKVRQDKSFCDDACRQRYHYHNKVKPRRQGKRL